MLRVPMLPTVMLASMGVFQLLAAVASFAPRFVHDRVPEQFVPVWTFLTRPLFGESPNESLVHALAVASQIVIGTSEAIIGIALVAAASLPARRATLANFGLGYATGLFTVFMLVTFAMHDPALPKWHQYPAILAWIAATWLVVTLTDQLRARDSIRS